MHITWITFLFINGPLLLRMYSDHHYFCIAVCHYLSTHLSLYLYLSIAPFLCPSFLLSLSFSLSPFFSIFFCLSDRLVVCLFVCLCISLSLFFFSLFLSLSLSFVPLISTFSYLLLRPDCIPRPVVFLWCDRRSCEENWRCPPSERRSVRRRLWTNGPSCATWELYQYG